MRTSIKGQALAEFLLEIPGDAKTVVQTKELLGIGQSKDILKWTLFTDEASSKEGLGAGLILTRPEGEEITYAPSFDFHTPNNEGEYEALLADLRLAKQMGAEAIVALTDSRLPANQINEEFETKDKQMEKYVKVVQRLVDPSKSSPLIRSQKEKKEETLLAS